MINNIILKFINNMQKNPIREINIMSYKDDNHYIRLGCCLDHACVRTWVLNCLRFATDLSLFVNLLLNLGPRNCLLFSRLV